MVIIIDQVILPVGLEKALITPTCSKPRDRTALPKLAVYANVGRNHLNLPNIFQVVSEPPLNYPALKPQYILNDYYCAKCPARLKKISWNMLKKLLGSYSSC